MARSPLPTRFRLAFYLPALAALAVGLPMLWILVGGLLERGTGKLLLDTVPAYAEMVTGALEAGPREVQSRLADMTRDGGPRVTVISASGRVLADSARTPDEVAAMDNHRGRPEVAGALQTGSGRSVRRSSTTGLHYVYAARALRDRAGNRFVLRLAQPLAELRSLHRRLALSFAAASLAALLATSGLLWWADRRLSPSISELLAGVRRLEAGDFGHRVGAADDRTLSSAGRFLDRIAARAERRITALEVERRHLVGVVASMSDGVLVTDSEGLARLANPAFRELFEIDDEVEGRSPLELTRQPRIEDLVVETLSSGEPAVIDLELAAPRARSVSLSSTALADRSGAVLVARDLTELVRLSRMRRDFVANVSHELKTPLAAIRGFAETLRDGALGEPAVAERFLGRILQQCARLQALLEDLLTLSRLESLAGRGDRRPVSLAAAIEDACEAVSPQIEERRIALEVEIEARPVVSGDREAIERLLVNLLSNGIKYNRRGGRLSVRLAEGEGAARIEVTDNGIGIPEEALSRVFERFYRVDKGRSRDEGGTGLGLAIVKHVAQLHGGRVDVESRLGEGSRFRVTLPLDRPAASSIVAPL